MAEKANMNMLASRTDKYNDIKSQQKFQYYRLDHY